MEKEKCLREQQINLPGESLGVLQEYQDPSPVLEQLEDNCAQSKIIQVMQRRGFVHCFKRELLSMDGWND